MQTATHWWTPTLVASGFQVDVAVGETPIAMRLAAGGTALTYTVIVERDSAARYGWTPTKDFNNLLQDNPDLAGDAIRGVWGDETTMYVAPLNFPKVFAYTRATEARDESKDIATNQGSRLTEYGFKAGIWSDGTTMWVLNYRYGEDMNGMEVSDGTGKVFAFNLNDGVRDTTKEFPLHLDPEPAWDSRGIWSDGITVWVSNWKAAKLFAYTLATGDPVPESDITLHHLNDGAQGISSDGTTIWVAQWNSLKFFAYDLATGVYDPDNDFVRAPGNLYPRDVWSDGTTLYVSDHFGKLFAYNMTEPAMDAELSALTLSGITLSPQFASSIYTYSADAATTLAETTVTATTSNSNAVAVIKLNGVEDADGTVGLAEGSNNVITVEVTATDGTTMRTYTVTVTRLGTIGVTVSESSLTIEEGGSGTYTVVLDTLPTGDVMVDIGSDNTDVTVSSSSLTFTTSNWNAEQTVTVTAAQDADATDDTATVTHTVSGYGSVVTAASVTVTVAENPTAPYDTRWKQPVSTRTVAEEASAAVRGYLSDGTPPRRWPALWSAATSPASDESVEPALPFGGNPVRQRPGMQHAPRAVPECTRPTRIIT